MNIHGLRECSQAMVTVGYVVTEGMTLIILIVGWQRQRIDVEATVLGMVPL
jgi:hypothetical protein